MDFSAGKVRAVEGIGVLRLARCFLRSIEFLRVAARGFDVALFSSADSSGPVRDAKQIRRHAGWRIKRSHVGPMAHLQRVECRKMSGGEAVILKHPHVVVSLGSAGDDLL